MPLRGDHTPNDQPPSTAQPRARELRLSRRPAGWGPTGSVGTQTRPGDPIAGSNRRYLVLVSRVVVVPPSRSVSVFVWVSVLPPIPS
jgi:hypothetical protein